MQTNQKNKMMTGKEKQVKNKELFYYPDHDVSVEASSKEEADELLKEKLSKK